jgi:hypothetical protein
VQLFLHRGGTPRAAGLEQLLQNALDPRFALPGRQVQDAQVLLGRPLRLLLDQPVIHQPKATRREQVVAVAVVGERPRLAHQPVDDVPVLDAMLAPTAQPGQAFDQALGIPDLEVLRVQPGLDPFADQPAGHRVGVAADVDGAATIHAHVQALAGVEALCRQGPQQRQFLDEPPLPALITLNEQLPHKRLVGGPAVKVPAAAQHQGLVQCPFELAVALLDIAVLMGLRRVDRLALQAIVPQQCLVTLLKGRAVTAGRDRGRQRIGPMHPRNTAQFGQGVLQPVAEALEALGKADGAALPVRVGQHEMVNQVRKRLTADGDLQARRVREVGGTQPARLMHLLEKDLLDRPVQGAPLLDVSLQGAQLPIGEAAGVRLLQPGEQGLGLQAGVERQLLLDPVPDVGEGIAPGSPGMVHAYLTGQFAEPPVLAGGLVVDAGLGRSLTFAKSQLIAAAQPTDVQIGDHPKPPCRKGLRIDYAAQLHGKSNCR